jgi:hypothetical protein
MATQFDTGDPAADAVDAAALEAELAAGIAPPKGSPRRTRLEAAHERHTARRAGKDPAAKAEKARRKAAKAAMVAADSLLAMKCAQAFAPVCSPQVAEKAKHDPSLAFNIKSREGVRAVLRGELERQLPARLFKALGDSSRVPDRGRTDPPETCPTCAGEGEIGRGFPCGDCGGFGIVTADLSPAGVAKELATVKKAKKAAKSAAKSLGKAARTTAAAKVLASGSVRIGIADKPGRAIDTPRGRRVFDAQLAKELGVKPGQVTVESMTPGELKKASQ